MRGGKPLGLLMIDVDEFTSYNVAFGHPAGDAARPTIASATRTIVRSRDFFARYGGEEFSVILPSTDVTGSICLAERLRAAIEAASWPLRQVPPASVRGPRCPNETAIGTLIAKADSAFYGQARWK